MFFACKNILVILLQAYRLYVIWDKFNVGKAQMTTEDKFLLATNNENTVLRFAEYNNITYLTLLVRITLARHCFICATRNGSKCYVNEKAA